MTLPLEIQNKLKNLQSGSNFEKMVGVVGIISELVGEKWKPVVVGGLAVEIYTRGEYTTVDVDLIYSDLEKIGKLLESLNFERQGRHWLHPDLLISVEFPGAFLEDADFHRIVEVQLPDGSKMYVIGIEDIILDRLRACLHWKSVSDCEWAERLYTIHKEKLDKEYLKQKAIQDQTIEVLEKFYE